MTESTDLIVPLEVNQDTAKKLYSNKDKGFDTLKTDISKVLAENPASVETEAERAAVRSLAHKITRTKTAVDGMGADLAEKMRKTVAAIDASRRHFKVDLDTMRDEYRKPLTDYEEREKKKEQERTRRLGELEKLKTVPFDATSDSIQAMIQDAEEQIEFDDWGDKLEERAATVYEDAIKILRTAKEAATTREAMAAENARLEQERKNLEAEQERIRLRNQEEEEKRQAEIDRLKAEKQAEEGARIEAERETERLKKQADEDAAAALRKAEQEEEQRKADQQAELKRKRDEEAKQAADQKAAEERAADRQKRKTEAVNDLAEYLDSSRGAPVTVIAKNIYDAIEGGRIRHVAAV